MRYHTTQPLESIDVLLSKEYFPSLRSLSINALLGISWDHERFLVDEDGYSYHKDIPPTLEPANCIELLLRILNESTVRNVDIIVGQWERYDHGWWPMGWVSWEKRHRMKWAAREELSIRKVLIEGYPPGIAGDEIVWPHEPILIHEQ